MLNLNKTKWMIINELSKQERTPTELAKKLKITLPSVHLQLKNLQTEGLVKKIENISGKTRSYSRYSLGEGFVYFIKALPNETERRFLEVDQNLLLHLRIWSIPQKEYHYYIENFWWQLQDYLDDFDAIVIYGSVANGQARGGSDIDVLLLVKKDVKRYENTYNAKMIGIRGKRKMIMCQVFKTEDFENSLKKGSDFALSVMKNSVVIYDPNYSFTKLKNEP